MDFAQVSEDYFRTLGTELLAGRTFTAGDATGDGPTSLIVNESFARQYWGDQDPLGRRVKIGRDPEGPGPELTVIGVVADVRQRAVSEAGGPQSYIFYRRMPSNQMRVVVKSDADLALVAPALRQAVWEVDASIPVEVGLLEDQVAGTLTSSRFYAAILAAFAALALALAAVGLYGTLSYIVGERRREMGIRVALGAGASAVRRLVVRQGATMTAIGVGVGLVGAVLGTRLMEGLLFGTAPLDPAAFVASVGATGRCLPPGVLHPGLAGDPGGSHGGAPGGVARPPKRGLTSGPEPLARRYAPPAWADHESGFVAPLFRL